MKLIYRGVTYEYDPNKTQTGNTGRPGHNVDTHRAPYVLMYRGQEIVINPNAPHVPAEPTTHNLIYRGVSYQVDRDGNGGVTMTSQPAKFVWFNWSWPHRAFNFRLSATEVDRIHQANLVENLQRRLKVAKERGDQKLVELLEAERRQMGAWGH